MFLSLPKIIKSVYKEKKVKMNNKEEKVSISNSTNSLFPSLYLIYVYLSILLPVMYVFHH